MLASVIQVYVGTDRLAGWLRRSTPLAVLGAVALGALTPFCSCGTMAVVLGSLASSVPWAPVVAFMASSPLTSPGEYVWSVGLFGPGFATTFLVAAAGVGLLGGGAAWVLERHGWLANQARVVAPVRATRAEPAAKVVTDDRVLVGGGGCGTESCAGSSDGTEDLTRDTVTTTSPGRHHDLLRAVLTNGSRLTVYFLAFATLGYLLIELVPTSVLEQHLGEGNALTAVPLAALLGVRSTSTPTARCPSWPL